jgi:tetraacyldisaccharide 4'-kinase
MGVALWPLARVWSAGARARVALYEGGFLRRYRLKRPVVSVGNLSVGGTGKTPFVMWLWRELQARGVQASVLTRGYRRRDAREPQIFRSPAGSEGAGDEARLMLESGVRPVGIATKRELAGAAIEAEEHVDLHLLDDGFQHLCLVRELDIVLLDCTRPPWEYDLLPSGRFREPWSALARAGIIVLTRAYDWTPVEDLRRQVREANRHALLTRSVTQVTGLAADLSPVFAFAGVGNPKAFFDDLGRARVEVAGSMGFPDHHRYSPRDLDRIVRRARECGARTLVTTAKDRINLGGLAPDGWRLEVAGLTLVVEDGGRVVDHVAEVVRR